MGIGKGGIIAAGALVLATGAIGYRLTTGDDAPAAAAVPADPLAAMERDAKANPGDAGSWQRLGIAYFDAGRFADAAGPGRHRTLNRRRSRPITRHPLVAGGHPPMAVRATSDG